MFGVSGTQVEEVVSYRIADHLPERRRHGRRGIRIAATARRTDHTLAAHREPVVTLTVTDVSDGGLGARSPSPVFPGERMMIRLSPGTRLPSQIFGRVVRCDARGDGYKLAIEFDQISAA